MTERQPNLFLPDWRRFAAARKLNLRRLPDNSAFYYSHIDNVWQAWKARSDLAVQLEGDVIHNAAIQQAQEVAYAMAGPTVAKAIETLKINLMEKRA